MPQESLVPGETQLGSICQFKLVDDNYGKVLSVCPNLFLNFCRSSISRIPEVVIQENLKELCPHKVTILFLCVYFCLLPTKVNVNVVVNNPSII